MKFSTITRLETIIVFGFCVILPSMSMAGSAYVGMQPQELTPQAMSALGLDNRTGVIIRNVGDDTPASTAGIEQGDVLLKISGKSLTSLKQLIEIISAQTPGHVLEITLLRSGEEVDVSMIIGDWDDATRLRNNKSSQINELGISVIGLTDKVRSQFDVRWDVGGVLISIVDPSKGISETLKRGDVITQFNQHKIWNPDQLPSLYNQAKEAGRNSVLLLVLREAGFVFVILPVR